MSDVKVSVGVGEAIGKVLESVFTGGSSDAVIAILLLAVGLMGFFIFKMSRKLDKKDELISTITESYNAELKDLTKRYMDSLQKLTERQTEETRIMNASLQSTQLVLTEIKTLLNYVLPAHRPYDTSETGNVRQK